MFEEDQLEPSYTMSEDDFVKEYGEENRKSIRLALEGMKYVSTEAREAAVMGWIDYERRDGMLKKGRYIGNDRLLRGKTALVMTVGEKAPRGIVPEGKVMIQADDVSTGLGHGWHEFPAEDWEIKIL